MDWRKMAWQVPVSSCLWFGMIKVCFSPLELTLRSFRWLPDWEIIANPKRCRIETTSLPESRLSLGIRGLNFHRHHEGWIRRKAKF